MGMGLHPQRVFHIYSAQGQGTEQEAKQEKSRTFDVGEQGPVLLQGLPGHRLSVMPRLGGHRVHHLPSLS